MSQHPTAWRGAETVRLYAAYMIGAFAINGMGSILLPLQVELGVGRPQVSIYPLMYSSALMVVGLVGSRILKGVPRRALMITALSLSFTGATLVGIPNQIVIGIGAVTMGLGGALFTLITPLRLAEIHGARSGRAFTEANALSSLGTVLAPILVGVALSIGVGWRVGYQVPMAALAGTLLFLQLRNSDGGASSRGTEKVQHGTPLPLLAILRRWVDIPLAVLTEFSLVFWAASATLDWHGVDQATATLTAAMFLVGMATGRTLGGPLMELYAPRILVLGGSVIGMVGFFTFWLAPHHIVGAVGLFIAGLGVAILYPASQTRLIASDPNARERSAQLGALGIGMSSGLAPVILALLAEQVGMWWAYLVVPTLLSILFLKNLRPGLGDSVQPVTEDPATSV